MSHSGLKQKYFYILCVLPHISLEATHTIIEDNPKRSKAQASSIIPHTQAINLHFELLRSRKQSRQVLWRDQFFIIYTNTAILLQRDEPRRVCSSNTGATMLDWLVGDGELAQVVTAHLRLWREETG